MKRFLLILPIFILLNSCSLFKNVATHTQGSHQLNSIQTDLSAVEQKDWLSHTESLSFYKDSGKHDYAVQIWPKGTFTFSPEKGFSGEADRIFINGSISKDAISSMLQSQGKQDKGAITTTLNERKKQVQDQQQKERKTSFSWKWILAGATLVILLAWYVYQKF